PWFKDYVHRLGPKDFAFAKKNIAYDGRPVLKGVKCPLLIVVGERDTIVPAKENATIIAETLTRAGNKDVTIKTFANADHFMHTTKAGGPREISTKERKKEFVPDYFATITDWIAPRVRATP